VIPLARVRSIEWVPDVLTLLVRRAWYRDPWRLVVEDAEQGERCFHAVAEALPNASEPVESRVGPNDLALDPGMLFGMFLVFCVMLALIGGALEGMGQAPVSAFEWLFRLVGKGVGVTAVCTLAALILAVGVFALVRWYQRRPRKIVVRAR
jgi:hypothetical protein